MPVCQLTGQFKGPVDLARPAVVLHKQQHRLQCLRIPVMCLLQPLFRILVLSFPVSEERECQHRLQVILVITQHLPVACPGGRFITGLQVDLCQVEVCRHKIRLLLQCRLKGSPGRIPVILCQ